MTINNSVLISDDVAYIEIHHLRDSDQHVFISLKDEYDYSARSSFGKDQIDRIISELTRIREVMA